MDGVTTQLIGGGILVVLVLKELPRIYTSIAGNGKHADACIDRSEWRLHRDSMTRVALKLSDDSPRQHTEALEKLGANGEEIVAKLCDIEKAIINGNGKHKP